LIGSPFGSGGAAGRVEQAASVMAATDATNEVAVFIVPRSQVRVIRVSYNMLSFARS
jgi:hypothetical protein